MNYQVKQRNGIFYLIAGEGELLIGDEQDAIDLIALCGEENTDKLILFADNLSQEFFDLKTGLAGAVLQKFANYRIKCAIIIPPALDRGRFHEMLVEINRQNSVHFFENANDAEDWIVGNFK